MSIKIKQALFVSAECKKQKLLIIWKLKAEVRIEIGFKPFLIINCVTDGNYCDFGRCNYVICQLWVQNKVQLFRTKFACS